MYKLNPITGKMDLVNFDDQYTYSTDPATGLKARTGMRDSIYVIDKELTTTGFAGSETTDWENIFSAE